MQNGRKHLGMKNECLGNSNQGKHLAVGKKKKQRHSKRHSFLLGFYCCTVRRAVPFSTVALLSLSSTCCLARGFFDFLCHKSVFGTKQTEANSHYCWKIYKVILFTIKYIKLVC